MTTKIYDTLNNLGQNITYKSGDPQLIYDYSSLGTSINIKYIPEDYTNVLYFDGDVYRLDHDLEHQPIVLYKIPPNTINGELKGCYYERRQLEIHHVSNNSNKKLILVIPFRSVDNFNYFNSGCNDDNTNINIIEYKPDPNSLNLSDLMNKINDKDNVYYEESSDTTTIFYTEQYLNWDDDMSFWNGSFMDLPQLQKLRGLCSENEYANMLGCTDTGTDTGTGYDNYPDDLSNGNYDINYANPYLNYHHLSSETDHATLSSNSTIYAIRNGTEYNESILSSTLRSDAAGLGLDTTSGSDDDDGEGTTDDVDDDEIVIDCSPINTTEEEIITKMDKDSLLKLNSGYTWKRIIKQFRNAISNAESSTEEGYTDRSDNFKIALDKELKKLEDREGGGGGWGINITTPTEIIIGIIIGIISCIVFNIILNKVLKN
jgi:hypothetical protein